MHAASAFIDSNVVLYLLSGDHLKADRAEQLIAAGAVCSVQVLNEVASVALRKLRMPWAELDEFLSVLRKLCRVVDVTGPVHCMGLDVARRYRISVYDAMIIANALQEKCTTLWSEDMHHGLRVHGGLTIRSPFAS